MIQLKEITEHSWLVLDDSGIFRIGLLSEHPNKKFIFLAKDSTKATFNDKADINAFFKEDIFRNVLTIQEKDKEFFVKGFPVDYENPSEVDTEDELSVLPLYAKTDSSDVYHCAGYYCIDFPKSWLPSFCPKYATLTKYKYAGPFRTEMEMKSHLSMLKKNDERNRKI